MRDYSSISPSAKSLLLMKGLTDIPFIADAAKLVWGDDIANTTANWKKNETYIKRLLHFESRYISINNLLDALGGRHILEISSGFSFRGLDMALNHPDVFYIDTDLPEVTEMKADLTAQLISQQNLQLKGQLQTTSMNALDQDIFTDIINRFPPGPVNIVNEGLLVYLDTAEKTRLCEIIRQALTERGGHWITADVYIKRDVNLNLSNDVFSKFLEAHKVEENKFESFEQAAEFFKSCGLRIKQKSGPVWHQLSAPKYLSKQAVAELVQTAGKVGKIRETWALVPC